MFDWNALQLCPPSKPESAAVVTADLTLSWSRFTGAARRLSGHLLETWRLPRNHPVIVRGHKEAAFVVATFAVLEAGGCVVPVEAGIPDGRLKRIAQILGSGVLIDVSGRPITLPGVSTIDFRTLEPRGHEPLAPSSSAEPALLPCVGALAADAPRVAYCMFTSGSTGEPKAVPILAESMPNFLAWITSTLDFRTTDVFMNQVSYGFDVSWFETVGFSALGSTLLVVDSEATDRARIVDQLKTGGCTVWVSTPSFATTTLSVADFNGSHLPTLRSFVFCGEVLSVRLYRLLRARFPAARIFNTYGPTEANVAATAIEVDDALIERWNTIPIGIARQGTRVEIESDPERAGEIVLIGPHVSTGYINRPDLNDERFGLKGDLRFYRTGDFGHAQEGLVFYTGRKDSQIKIRGHRVELGEVEAVLGGLADLVAEVVVTVVKNTFGEAVRMVAFVRIGPDAEGLAGSDACARIKSAGLDVAPPYLIPTFMVLVDTFPLTSSHKIDRGQLERHAPAAVRDAMRFPRDFVRDTLATVEAPA